MASIPHPIHRIPSELLSEILIQGTPLKYTRASKRCSIIAPSHVCRHWRSVALSTPLLWTFILFQCKRKKYIPRELDCARAWLSRSGECALAIKIHGPYSDTAFQSAMGLLIPYCMRWRTIETYAFNIPSGMFSQIKGNVPLLESADLGTVESHESVSVLAIAPRLRRLQLTTSNSAPSFQLALVTIPWIQLVHLEISSDKVVINSKITTALLDILALASNMTVLKVNLDERDTSGAEHKTITTSNLSTLHISKTHRRVRNAMHDFLDHLVLPALRNLIAVPTLEWRNIISLISRSACSLSSLQITMYQRPDFVGLMQLLPTLQELTVNFLEIHEWHMMMASFTLQHGLHLTPNLRSLTLHAPSLRNEEILALDHFADMVESRWKPQSATALDASSVSSPLRRVRVKRFHPEGITDSTSSTFARLRRFSKEGLDVTFFTNDIHARDLLLDPPSYGM
ncbi:hypothetical protein FIBSPDRAFT_929068 [Athelia psychrophila]|uniref:Uncharacterized protein n=1 Tax=Athelia psychrophila TaxID=1759441 RepID=A0A166P9P6_9AGAM|nr:hypothetical protein FIBSPDRAFT_929068 [Fibularhizoctonia sp. CBS 109695]